MTMNSQTTLLATLLFSETKDENDAIGIANVVRNRMARPERFGGSLEDVVFAPHQFSGVDTSEWGKAAAKDFNEDEARIYKKFLSIANRALRGELEDITGGADHYVNLKLAQPSWSKKYKKTGKIGQHTYFKE